MEMGLLIPGRQGNLYDFSEDAAEDLRWIYKLKHMGFSLKEIQKILALRRISNWVEPQEIAEYLILLDEKKHCLEHKITEIQTEIAKLEEEKQHFASLAAGRQTLIGVPLKALEYLRCPYCGEAFAVADVQMNSRYIYNGRLTCPCGYQMEICDGILVTPDAVCDGEEQGDINREKYKNLPAAVITMLQRSYTFLLHRLQEKTLENRLVLEPDINEFFYLYTHFRKLDTRALFIVTDRYPQVLRMYKERIEYMKLDLDIVYLAAERHFPIKKNSVDLLIDYFTSDYWSRTGKGFFPEQMEGLLKGHGEILGCCYSEGGAKNPEVSSGFLRTLKKQYYALQKDRRIPCPKEVGEESELLLYAAVRKKKEE